MTNKMSEEKKIILRMLKEGKITEEEALTLLDSIKENREKKNEFNFSQFEANFIDKIAQAASKISKKSQEVISNIDLDDISTMFNQNLDFKAKAERFVSENISEIEKPKLKVETESGKIKIFGWESEEIEAKADISYDEKMISANHSFIKLERDGDFVTIRPDYENSRTKNFEMNVSIAVPSKLFESIELSSTNGSIEIESIKTENLKVNSTNSRILTQHLESKSTDISSTNARIYINDIYGEDLKVDTTNGKIEVKGVNAEEVNLNTYNGSVLITDLKEKVRDIKVSTFNGNISVSLKDMFRPIRAKVSTHSKETTTSNFSEAFFTNFVTEDNTMIAYSDKYEESEDKIDIVASTYNGAVNIN